MNFLTALGVTAAVCTTTSYFPQVLKVWRTREAGDLSAKTLGLLSAGLAMWAVYGFFSNDWVIVAANLVSVAMSGYLLGFKLFGRADRLSPKPNDEASSRTARARNPTYPPPGARSLGRVLDRNIEALRQRRAQEGREASMQERAADAITRFTGSMTFVLIHLLLFGGWIIANTGLIPAIRPWDESFVVLAMIASVEAIFLSTFVLISQNRMAAADDKRADLDLQVSLLAEHELTKVATLLSEMARTMGVHSSVEGELEEVRRDVAPDAVMDEIERR